MSSTVNGLTVVIVATAAACIAFAILLILVA